MNFPLTSFYLSHSFVTLLLGKNFHSTILIKFREGSITIKKGGNEVI